MAITWQVAYRSTPNLIGYRPGWFNLNRNILLKKKKLFCYTSFFGEIVAKLFILSEPNHLRMYNLVELCTDYHNTVLNKQKICDRLTYRLRKKVAKSVEILMGETTLKIKTILYRTVPYELFLLIIFFCKVWRKIIYVPYLYE